MSDGVPQNENELVEEVSGMTSDEIAHLRQRALRQVYFMARGVLGHKDVNPRTHKDLCQFLDFRDRSHPEFRDRRMALMPRGTLKSTIATEADALRLGLEDPNNARILIANEVVGNAIGMVGAIMGYCEKCDLLRLLFADRIPARTTGPGVKWSSTDGAALIRSTSWKEPTWTPIGIGGAAVSKHYTHFKIDDMIGQEAFDSEAKMKSTISWLRNIEGLIVSEYVTIIDWIGTRWRRRDAYKWVMEKYGEEMRVFTRKFYEEDDEGNKILLFPEHYSLKKLALLMKDPANFYAQYMNDPISEELTDFLEENLRYFKFAPDGSVLVAGNKWPREALDVVLTVDPNGGSKTAPDEAAITVSGVTPNEEICVLASWAARCDPDELIDKIYSLAMRWRPRANGIEKAGQQNTTHYFKKKMRETGVFFNVQPVHHKNQEKMQRIRSALMTPVTDHKLFLLQSQTELRRQILDFPDNENDDRIDSLAYGPQVWRKGLSAEALEEKDEAVSLVMKARNQRTGY